MNVLTVDFSNKNRLDKKYLAIYERLRSIAKKYYDAELNYKAFSNNPSKSEESLISLLNKNSPLVLPERILYPILINKSVVGFCELKTEKNLNKLEKVRLKHLIDLLLTHSLKSSQRLSTLREKEHNSQHSLEDSEEAHKNIIQIHKFRKPQVPVIENTSPKANLKLNVSIFINGANSEDNFKMARELHDFSDRFAFISLSDLDIDSIEKNGFDSLGPVTVFIPEILELTDKAKTIIKSYYKLEQRDKASCPQFITASRKNIQDLTKNQLIDKELLIHFTSVHLTLDHDFSHYRKFGIMDFVFESMTKSRS